MASTEEVSHLVELMTDMSAALHCTKRICMNYLVIINVRVRPGEEF